MKTTDQAVWKRTLNCGVSLGVFAATAIGKAVARLFGYKPQGSCIVLYYHSVPPDQRQQFANQLDVLLREADPIDIGGAVRLTPGRHHVGVTFDDAFENFVQCALPELEKRKIPSTVFVISDVLGKKFGPSGHPEQVMSFDQAQSLPKGLVTIGSHTMTHPLLPSVSKQHARTEIVQSRMRLEEMFKRQVSLFSFPFGGFNEQLVAYCHEAGYERVFTTLPTFAFVNPKDFVVGRVRVDPADWPLEFRLKLAGAYRWLPYAFSIKKKLRFHSTNLAFAQDVPDKTQ
jgi:peptidoglycan/xylan/chitin deacetylase (PgdA/CDA1 family)